MSFWAEVRNDFWNTKPFPEDGDCLAYVSIDAWKTMNENEGGNVVARVMLSKHGDVLVDYIDTMARTDEMAQEAIGEAKTRLQEYFAEYQKNQGQVSGVALGSTRFVDWAILDNAVDKWAKGYFGEHVKGQGSRDEDSFEIEFKGLLHGDFEKFSMLFERYDTENGYEPEYEFAVGEQMSGLPADMSRCLMPEVLGETVLVAYGTALATYNGVFFMERDREGRLERGLDDKLADAQERAVGDETPGREPDLSLE